MDTIFALVLAFFADPFVKAVLGLIVLDFLLGVAAALKNREFDFAKLADFYVTNVIPYVLGYLAFYIATHLIVDPAILGDWADLVGEVAIKVAWLAIVGTLGNSIINNMKKLGLRK